MTLVAYSDSEDSGAEEVPQQKANPAPKSAILKITKDTNPRKIVVNLPTVSKDLSEQADNRPAKRQRTGNGSAFSELSSLLPAPKRTGAISSPSNAPLISQTQTASPLRVSLKTGSAPAFSRTTLTGEDGSNVQFIDDHKAPVIATELDADEVQVVGKVTMFKPLSVSRNIQQKKKKKKSVAAAVLLTQTSMPPPPKPKVSLFSLSAVDNSTDSPPDVMMEDAVIDGSYEDTTAIETRSNEPYLTSLDLPSLSSNQTLEAIASQVNLDAASRRKLFGHKGKGDVSVNLVTFNADEEYAANEQIRAKGDIVQHNPLRSAQSGKHSLRQMINAATSQNDALEEAWAAGKRNKKEAASRYGW